MIMRAAVTAQQNKKECEQLARRVLMIADLLPHLQDPEVMRRAEVRRPLVGLDETLREAHELVMACQERSVVFRLVMAGRQAEKFRDVQSRIDSYLLVFPFISHINITCRLDRIYNILLPNSTNLPSPSSGSESQPQDAEEVTWEVPHGVNALGPSTPPVSMPRISVTASQDAAKIDSNEPHEVQGFTFEELAVATNNFATNLKIGEGGSSRVYMGRFPDGREVAVKRFLKTPNSNKDFLRELTSLTPIRHKHIVRLFGSCVLEEDERLLVFEYMENGSLHDHLYGRPSSSSSSSPVTASWKMRFKILLGVSQAIEYLQSYAGRPVIHRDINPSNILLDVNWAPCLTDFGLSLTSEVADEKIVCGTYGYMAPEYVMQGTVNSTTDVYSFGFVMLEVLTAKNSFFQEWGESENTFVRHGLATIALSLIEAGELYRVLDRRPAAEPTPRQLEAVELVAQTAAHCLRLQAEDRPSISQVVANLETALELACCDGRARHGQWTAR